MWMGARNGFAGLLLGVVVLALCFGTTRASQGCSKSLWDECTSSIPLPLSLRSDAEVLRIAQGAEHVDHLAQELYAIPSHNLINRTCAIYQGMRGCDGPIRRLCPYSRLQQYHDFRTAFNDLCGLIGRIKYKNHYQCLTQSDDLNARVLKCLQGYRSAVGTQIGNTTVESTHHMSTLCRAAQTLKTCSMKAVADTCGQYTREFWFQFSYPRDENLDAKQYCNQMIRNRLTELSVPVYVNASRWYLCDDGSNVYPHGYKCDEEDDCYNGEDERECEYNKGPTRLSTVAIVGIIAGIIAFIVAIICAMKAIKECQFRKQTGKKKYPYTEAKTSETPQCAIEMKEQEI